MRLNISLAVLTVFCVVGVTGSASAKGHHKPAHAAKAPVSPDYKYIKGVYDYRSYGYAILDCNQVYSYMSPDYVETDLHGEQSDRSEGITATYNVFKLLQHRESELNEAFQKRGGRSFTNLIKDKVTINSFSVSGNNATVVETQELNVGVYGVMADGRQDSMTFLIGTYAFRDVWVRAQKRWLQQSSTELR